MRKAIHKYPQDEDNEGDCDESQELRILGKILNNQPIEIEEVKDGKES